MRRWTQATQLESLEGAFDAMAYEMEERLACSQGLELRYPFFNHKIIQLAFSTPERLRSRGREVKRLHRRALAGFLPELVLRRADKADFMVMFRRQLDPLIDQIRSDILPRRLDWIWPGRRTRSGPRTTIPWRPGDANGGCGCSSAVMPSCLRSKPPSGAPFEV